MKNLRKTLLINPEFQKKFIVLTLCFSLSVVAIIYLSIHFFFLRLHTMGVNAGLQKGHLFFEFVSQQRDMMDQTILIIASLTIVSGIFFGLVLSHRISGPLYRLCKDLEQTNEQNLKPIKFRKNDYFPEVAEAVNRLIEVLKK